MSFRRTASISAATITSARKHVAHDHVVFHMSSGASVTFNDPRRFGSMKLVARDKLDAEPLLKGLGPEPLGNEFDAALLARACHGKKTSLKAALLDQRIVAGLGNIYVCEALYRGAPVAEASGLDDRRAATARRTNAPSGWSTPSRRCCRPRSKPAARRCAITGRPTAISACSSTTSRSTIARASRAGRRAAAAPSSASCRTAARPFIVRHVRSDCQTT